MEKDTLLACQRKADDLALILQKVRAVALAVGDCFDEVASVPAIQPRAEAYFSPMGEVLLDLVTEAAQCCGDAVNLLEQIRKEN